jgi:dihydrofolate synthase/folylpolyglutamate synthase
VREAAATVRSPGRLEVASLNPTVFIDGAHNEEGLRGLAAALEEELEEEKWTLVIGMRGERDVAHLLAALDGKIGRVVATEADDHLAVPVAQIAAAAEQALGVEVQSVKPVSAALEVALAETPADEGVVVAGSLYVVGEARHALGLDNAPSPVHRRFEPSLETGYE